MARMVAVQTVQRVLERIWYQPEVASRVARLSDRTRRHLSAILLSDAPRRGFGLDQLEDRIALSANLPLLDVPVVDSTAALIQSPEVAASSENGVRGLPVFAGPGENSIVEWILPDGTSVDPNSIPVFAGPGDNQVITITPGNSNPDPRGIPVFAGPGENVLIAADPTVQATIAAGFRTQQAVLFELAGTESGDASFAIFAGMGNAVVADPPGAVGDSPIETSPTVLGRTRPTAGNDSLPSDPSSFEVSGVPSAMRNASVAEEEASGEESPVRDSDTEIALPFVRSESGSRIGAAREAVETVPSEAEEPSTRDEDHAEPASHIEDGAEADPDDAAEAARAAILPQAAGLGVLAGQMVAMRKPREKNAE